MKLKYKTKLLQQNTINKIKTNKEQNGFTLIELLLYLSIVSIVVTSLVYFAINATKASVKSKVKQETVTNARYITERLNYEIRNAIGINTSTSNFGVNLATSSSYQLSIASTAPNNPTIFKINSGVLQISQGGGAFTDITSAEVTITSLVFTNNSSTNGDTKNISYVLTIESSANNTSQEYQDSMTLRSTIELRNN